MLQDRCSQLSAELALAESKLHAMQDVTSLRTAGAETEHARSEWNSQKVYKCEQLGCLLSHESQALKGLESRGPLVYGCISLHIVMQPQALYSIYRGPPPPMSVTTLPTGECMHAAMKHVGGLAGLFSSMLVEGAANPELVQHGYTTEEERAACGLTQVHPVHCCTFQAHEGLLQSSAALRMGEGHGAIWGGLSGMEGQISWALLYAVARSSEPQRAPACSAAAAWGRSL